MTVYRYRKDFSKSRNACCCLRSSLLYSSMISFCACVSCVYGSFSSAKNCDSVMLNASQIRSSDVMDGSIFLRYHEEIVDCVRPDFSASWYSLQLRSSLYSEIFSSISIKKIILKKHFALTFILVKKFVDR